jgi:hypothetical protein
MSNEKIREYNELIDEFYYAGISTVLHIALEFDDVNVVDLFAAEAVLCELVDARKITLSYFIITMEKINKLMIIKT